MIGFFIYQMSEIEYKNVAFQATEIKADQVTGRLNVKGYASVFGNEDSYGDIVEKGAFAESLAQEGQRVQFCYNHEMSKVCGVINELREDMKGLYMDVDILPTTLGKDLMILIEGNAIKEFSIGYRTKEFRDETINERTIRHLTQLKLIEVSAVSRAANPEATIISTSRKSENLINSLSELSYTDLLAAERAIKAEQIKRILTKIN